MSQFKSGDFIFVRRLGAAFATRVDGARVWFVQPPDYDHERSADAADIDLAEMQHPTWPAFEKFARAKLAESLEEMSKNLEARRLALGR